MAFFFAVGAGLAVGWDHPGWGTFLALLALMTDGGVRTVAVARLIEAVARRRG